MITEDVCWLCNTVQAQHHSKDHSFASKAEAIASVEFAIEVGGLIGKMNQYHEAHHVDLSASKMPIHNPGYAEGKIS